MVEDKFHMHYTIILRRRSAHRDIDTNILSKVILKIVRHMETDVIFHFFVYMKV